MNKEIFNNIKNENKTYKDMIKYCCDNMILNNSIMSKTMSEGYYWETYAGAEIYFTDENGNYITEEEYYRKEEAGEEVYQHYEDIYQYYIIGSQDAERLSDYTNELIYYCEDLDLYILGVRHYGTSWSYVPANWKDEL